MSTAAEPRRPTPADLAGTASRIGAAIESVIHGKPDAVRLILTVLIAAGHVLIEDVPGVGKTTPEDVVTELVQRLPVGMRSLGSQT